MKKMLPSLAVAALIALCGYVHGIWTDRWSLSQAMENNLERLAVFAPQVGDWHSTPLTLEDRATEAAGFMGYSLRRFENPRTGHTATVLLACGQSGPISVHTPEVCYAGAGYAMAADPSKRTITGLDNRATAEFWTAKFTKGLGVEGTPLRLYWAWRGSGGWEAPDNPRVHFAGQPFLYKLYIIQDLTGRDEAADEENGKAFLRQLMPVLNQGLDLRP